MRYSTCHKNNNQSGVTLLLAILIMSSLTLITLAIGSFAIQQLRNSRAVALSEPTIAAADSGGEQGLWAIKRATSIAACPAQSAQTLGNGTLINLCKKYDAAVINVKAGVPYTLLLYDPTCGIDGNCDTDLLLYPYNTITVAYGTGTTQVSVDVARLDGTSGGISPPSSTVNSGGQSTVSISPVAAGAEGRLKVVFSSVGDVSLTVDTDKGIPSFPSVDSLACGSRAPVASCSNAGAESFTRRINVKVGGLAGSGAGGLPVTPPTPPPPSSDASSPVVSAFDVQPRSTTDSVTATFTATDTGGSHLKNAELWRAVATSTCTITDNTGCTWSTITTTTAAAGLDSWSGTMSDTLALGSAYIYGVHVYDNAANPPGLEPGKILVVRPIVGEGQGGFIPKWVP